ncbi:hypothetical protein EDD11_009085, partial [Mortierella claussenii]
MDRPEHTNRNDERLSYPEELIPAMRLMLILAHLRKILLQDAVVLMESTGDSQCIYSRHHIFQDNVFNTNQDFINFSQELRAKMLDTKSPFCDSLRANAPLLDQRMQSTEAHVISLRKEIRDGLTTVSHAVDNDTEATMQVQSKQDAMMRGMEEMLQSCAGILYHMEKDVSVAREHRLQSQLVRRGQSRIPLGNRNEEASNQEDAYLSLSEHIEREIEQQGDEYQGPDVCSSREIVNQAQVLLQQSQQLPTGRGSPVDGAQKELLGDPWEKLTLAGLEHKIAETYEQLSVDEVKAAATSFVLLPRNMCYDDLQGLVFLLRLKAIHLQPGEISPKMARKKRRQIEAGYDLQEASYQCHIAGDPSADGPFSVRVKLGMAKVRAAIDEAGSLN